VIHSFDWIGKGAARLRSQNADGLTRRQPFDDTRA
jgi:hypothetical protein